MAHYSAYRLHWIHYGSDMSVNFYGAICAWTTCFVVTAVVTFFTKRKPEQGTRRTGLQLRHPRAGRTDRRLRGAWILTGVTIVVGILLNWIFY